MTDLFDIIDEQNDWLVINKDGDLVCHPTKGDERTSLIGRLRLYYQERPEVQPSFVNRLDRETSGIILIAKSRERHASLQRLFQGSGVNKYYHAVVHGVPTASSGTIEKPLGYSVGAEVRVQQAVVPDGSPSVTHWRVMGSQGNFSLLEVRPETGRLHQIRVHLSDLGHPVVGDKIYGGDPQCYLQFVKAGWSEDLEKRLLARRQLLHASRLTLQMTDQLCDWKAAIPSDMESFLNRHLHHWKEWQ